MKHTLVFSTILAGAALFGATLTQNQQDYLNSKIRIIARSATEVPGSLVYTYRRGNEVWKETNAVEHIAVDIKPVRYSKLKIIQAAKAADKWADVKAFIAANDLEDEWNACMYIEAGNDSFVAATNAVVTAGIATGEQVAAFLEAAKDDTL